MVFHRYSINGSYYYQYFSCDSFKLVPVLTLCPGSPISPSLDYVTSSWISTVFYQCQFSSSSGISSVLRTSGCFLLTSCAHPPKHSLKHGFYETFCDHSSRKYFVPLWCLIGSTHEALPDEAPRTTCVLVICEYVLSP